MVLDLPLDPVEENFHAGPLGARFGGHEIIGVVARLRDLQRPHQASRFQVVPDQRHSPQRDALASLVKIPLVYTNVLLRNWQAMAKLKVALALCPGSWHRVVTMDFPVSLGDYRFAAGPDEPVVLHMQRVPLKPGLPPSQQHRLGRHELLATSFETIEFPAVKADSPMRMNWCTPVIPPKTT